MTVEHRPTDFKRALVDFHKSQDFDWSITIGVGFCPPDEDILKRLTLIDAILSRKYLASRYHKLAPDRRFLTVVAFEGERSCGSRHAHLLVRIPTPLKKSTRTMLISSFPFEFMFLWNKLNPAADPALTPWSPTWSDTKGQSQPLHFARANVARKIYAIKHVQHNGIPWSRFEIVQPPKWNKFENENLSVAQNRDRQKRTALCLA